MAILTPFDKITLGEIEQLHKRGYNFIIHDGVLVYIHISRNA